MAAPRIPTTRKTLPGSVGVQLQMPHLQQVRSSATYALATTRDTDADLGYIDLLRGGADVMGKAIVTHVRIEALGTVAGTLAAASIGLYTAANAGGTAIVAPAVLTGLTTTGTVKAATVVDAIVTTGRLYIRQTTDSGNAGNIRVHVEYQNITATE